MEGTQKEQSKQIHSFVCSALFADRSLADAGKPSS